MKDDERRESFPVRILAAVLLVHVLAVVPGLGARTLWHVDEARFAAVAREMTATGDWLIPRIGGRVFASYPPLTYWTVAASGSLFGWSEWAVRLPSFLAGAALIVSAAFLAWRLTGSAAAAGIAAVVLAATPGFLIQEITCRADVLLALFTVAALILFLQAADSPPGTASPLVVSGFWLCLALGVLTKGPLGLFLPAFAAGPWILVRRRWDMLSILRPWWGIPLLLALTLPWYWIFSRRGGGAALEYNFLRENVEAFFSGFHHPRPFLYYVPRLALRALPWLLVLPALVVLTRERRDIVLPGLGLLVMFVFFSVSINKRVNYLTYFYPLLAVIEGAVLAGAAGLPWSRRAAAGMGGLLAVAAAGFTGSLILAPELWTADAVIARPGLLAVAGVVAAVLGGGIVVLSFRGRLPAALGTAGLGISAAFLLYATVINPETDVEGRRGTAFCRTFAGYVPEGESIGAFGLPEEATYYYYSPRRMENMRDLEDFRSRRLSYGFSYEADRPPGVRILTRFEEDNHRVLYLWRM